MRQILMAVALLALAGCGSNENSGQEMDASAPSSGFGFGQATGNDDAVERITTVDIEEPEASEAAGSAGNDIPVSIPQIAYTYEYGFRIANDQMTALQERHVAMCEALGAQTCRVLEMNSSGGEGDFASGFLHLAVAAERARDFGAQLGEAAQDANGEQVSASIAGEDLSKQIVDTEARLRARTVLRDRLMEILRNRQGTVAELVEAERGVAQVNEEIDQAQSWLAEMRGRVDYSQLRISYQSGSRSSGGFVQPIRRAIGSVGTILGTVIASLIVLATIVVPLGLLAWGGLILRRRFRKNPTPETEAANAET